MKLRTTTAFVVALSILGISAEWGPTKPIAGFAGESSAIKRRTPPVDPVIPSVPPVSGQANYEASAAGGFRVGTVHASLTGQLQPASAARANA